MRVIGNPTVQNSQKRSLVERVKIHSERIDLRAEILIHSTPQRSSVLDIGESLREFKSQLPASVEYASLDLLDEIEPTYQADICDENLLNEICERFDIVCCFSLLEHVYNPFAAARNLLGLTTRHGIVIGYVPFLFPRHCPEDLAYQDFFRFTRDSLGILFPTASAVEVWPDRGRLASSLICLSTSYKYVLEKRFPRTTARIAGVMKSGRHQLQTSGFQFKITK